MRKKKKGLKVLVACEYSGIVRDAFNSRGHEALSVDLLPSEGKRAGEHLQSDLKEILATRSSEFDLLIAFPPCTFLATSGARWWPGREVEQRKALEFVRYILDAPIDKIALENPVGIISTAIRDPDQIINPWQFGHPVSKTTCLWLDGLPPLKPTKIVKPLSSFVYGVPPGPDRGKKRGATFHGIASAMAEQWGNIGLTATTKQLRFPS